MSNETSQPSPPPPLIGEANFSDNTQEDSVAKSDPSESPEVTEPVASSGSVGDQRVSPYGESSVGISVTAVSDTEKSEVEEQKTAFNTPKEEVPTPKKNWGSSLIVTNDPFESEEGSPFDKPEGYIGTDPYRAVDSDVRRVDFSNVDES